MSDGTFSDFLASVVDRKRSELEKDEKAGGVTDGKSPL